MKTALLSLGLLVLPMTAQAATMTPAGIPAVVTTIGGTPNASFISVNSPADHLFFILNANAGNVQSGVVSNRQTEWKSQYDGIPTPSKLAEQTKILQKFLKRIRTSKSIVQDELAIRSRDLASTKNVKGLLDILTYTLPVTHRQQDLLAWRNGQFSDQQTVLLQRVQKLQSTYSLLNSLEADVRDLLAKTQSPRREMLSERDIKIFEAYANVFKGLKS